MGYRLDPRAPRAEATRAISNRPDHLVAILQVMRVAEQAAQGGSDDETLARACWALALWVEIHRVLGDLNGSPLDALIERNRFDAVHLLSLTPQVGLYSARYGALTAWPLIEALQILADAPVDLARERARVWTVLGG